MLKYIESRTLRAYDLRALCIKKNWYTRGNSDEYMQLFARLTENYHAVEMTADKLAEIATDIFQHSDESSCTDGFLEITDIMYELAKACSTTFREA